MIPAGWTLKATRRWMAQEAARYGEKFEVLSIDGTRRQPGVLRAFRNRHYLVQEYEPTSAQRASGVLVRLSVNRAVLNDAGGWLDGITWDQLQSVKAAVGYADHDALEVYPQATRVVNVANIRHLFIMAEPLAWKWGSDE